MSKCRISLSWQRDEDQKPFEMTEGDKGKKRRNGIRIWGGNGR
jgi:hypothetical protein